MSIRLKERQWVAHFGKDGNVLISGIEACTADEALSTLKKDRFSRNDLVKLDSEPLYQGSMGIELDTNEDNTMAGVSEICVKGTNQKLVDELTAAIAKAIGGMAVEFAFGNGSPEISARSLRNFTRRYNASVVTI